MEKEFLRKCLEAGMSLPEIGLLANRDPSTVGYWVEKHGLVANGRAKYAPRGGLTREQLEPLVDAGRSLEEIAAALGRSQGTIRHWLRKHGLETRNARGRRPRLSKDEIEAVLARGETTVHAICERHGETEFAITGSTRRVQCKRCRSEAVARRRRKVKVMLVDEAGGACIICGYNRCVAALEFHHLDPEQKRFGVAERGFTKGIATLREEAKKCVLLCANCHAEVEAGAATLPDDIVGAP